VDNVFKLKEMQTYAKSEAPYQKKYGKSKKEVLSARVKKCWDSKSDEEKQKYNAIFLEISKQIPNETYIELSKITDEINRDKFALTVPYRFEIFQDLFDENQRKRIDIINFLLWNVE
jgi:hypothetical protein